MLDSLNLEGLSSDFVTPKTKINHAGASWRSVQRISAMQNAESII
ncbi:MAG: hypothetical protein ACI831_001473, partial [Candidatus Azotimanducaceae bacterium]